MGKQNIKANIAKHREALEKMALDIWAKPEAGFREFNATKLQQDYLKNMGAKITSPVDVVETAFIAEYGSGKPIIGILGEFDALPGLSQKAGLFRTRWSRVLMVTPAVITCWVQPVYWHSPL